MSPRQITVPSECVTDAVTEPADTSDELARGCCPAAGL